MRGHGADLAPGRSSAAQQGEGRATALRVDPFGRLAETGSTDTEGGRQARPGSSGPDPGERVG